MLCDVGSDCPSDEFCVETNEHSVEVCRPPCDPFVDGCPSGSTCTELGPSFLPECAFDSCCTPLCSLLAPACPADTVCDPVWEQPPPAQENLGVCVAG